MVRYRVTVLKKGNNKAELGEEKEISLKAFAIWAKMSVVIVIRDYHSGGRSNEFGSANN